MIPATYIRLVQEYGVSAQDVQALWAEIHRHYTHSKRHYHNLDHLEDLLIQLTSVKDRIDNWPVILFTLYYHDIIYKSTKKNNEAKSADLASLRMNELSVSSPEIQLCYEQILATKAHTVSTNSDTNYFTDADLSILGRVPDEYDQYCQKIRKEYSIYPMFLYKKGRKKVVEHFLSMKRIYKTEEFFSKFEEQARHNLIRELITLK